MILGKNLRKSEKNTVMVFGLYNLRGSCYINTVLQLLFNDKKFQNVLAYDNENKTPLLQSLKKLYNESSLNNTRLFIEDCKKYITYMDFNMQNDIQEFLILLLDCLNKELQGKICCVNKNCRSFVGFLKNEWIKHHPDGISTIADTFHGQTITQIKCPNCKEIFHNAEVFTTLALDLESNNKHETINNLIYKYFEGDYIENWKCDKCKTCHEKVKRKIVLTRYPETLIITLKRFDFLRHGFKNIKQISFEETLIFDNEYCLYTNDIVYDLSSIGCHIGCNASGHYFAKVKTIDNKWITIDDDVISYDNGLDSNVYSTAYILMFSFKEFRE